MRDWLVKVEETHNREYLRFCGEEGMLNKWKEWKEFKKMIRYAEVMGRKDQKKQLNEEKWRKRGLGGGGD